MDFISAKEAAEKWNISQRRVDVLCGENRVVGAIRVGGRWIIPSDAEKPADKRVKSDDEPVEIRPFVKWAGGKSRQLRRTENVGF